VLVESCLPDGEEQMASMNRTCIIQALSLDSREVQSKQQEYFKYLLWATFGLSAVRFIGVSWQIWWHEAKADITVYILLGDEAVW
jgi:chitin synthase